MANAVLTTSESSAYDDQIEGRYHFPNTYLNQVKQAIGDFILYYEPRRTSGPNSATGRQAYFAMARVASVEPDSNLPGHHYARITDFIEFDQPVPFKEGGHYYESMLQKEDGSTNKGAFGRSVRNIPQSEFVLIVQTGLSNQPEPWEQPAQPIAPPNTHIDDSDDVPEYVPRVIVEQILNRKFRDVAFRRHVRSAYDNRCAVTGLRLINGGGRPEVQAAHIRPVEADGPDTVRNGIALTGTAHWLFDRGLLSFGDDYRILLSPHGVPDDLDKLIRPERQLMLPGQPAWRPHTTYLKWHRENRFKA
jgi:putative restriction endonuclease